MLDIRENIVYTNLDNEEIGPWKFLLQNLSLEKINNQFESYKNSSFARKQISKAVEILRKLILFS